jgi:hypothetical protein
MFMKFAKWTTELNTPGKNNFYCSPASPDGG